ncbi:hypothetical protein FO519_003998 [Halicephalobus sp. NKZ332]|nr:hypothetical protein FO519_003998 [Halicephalobus sp. NKZ332]
MESPEAIKAKILEFLTLLKENLPQNDPNSIKIDSLLKMKNGLDIYCRIAAQIHHLVNPYYGSVKENLFNIQKLVLLMNPNSWNRFKSWNEAYCEEIDAESKKFIYEIYEKLERDCEMDFQLMKDYMAEFKSLHEQIEGNNGAFTASYHNSGLEKHQRKVEECKRSLYCNVCDQRALVMCCFGAGYCSEICQTKDWILHQARCTREIFVVNCNQQSRIERMQIESTHHETDK